MSDIVLLQETWLANDELHLLCSLDNRFHGQGVSAMDSCDGVLRGRPYGGLGILWRKELSGCKIMNLENQRIMSMQIENSNQSINLFNIYMPCDHRDNLDEFIDLLSHLSTAVEEAHYPYIAMIGDFNANMKPGLNTLFGNELKRFCRDELLSISDASHCPPSTFTFFSESHQSVSWLDHCISNANFHSVIRNVDVMHDFVSSDHMPMLINVDLRSARVDLGDGNKEPVTGKVKWHKLTKDDLSQYQARTELHLDTISLNHELMLCDDPNCHNQSHLQAIDRMYVSMVQALKTAGEETLKKKQSKKYNTIPGWNDICREIHSTARDAFILWIQNGRPHSGFIQQNMQQTRAAFKQALRKCRASESRSHADSLARKLLLKDTKEFWSEIKRLCGKHSVPLVSTIGSATGSNAICELWRTHYAGILNSIPPNRRTDDIKQSLQNCVSLSDSLHATEVKCAIGNLKLGQACGLDTLSAEHFRYASNKLPVLLALCFNAMLLHGHVPKCFSDTILVPIIKDKKGNFTDMNNYRPIAITSVVSNIFEKIVLLRIQDSLSTNDNQFSFKSKHSTDLCIFTLKSVIDFFITSSSPVFLCYLDASKAFDKINYWVLFDKLKKRNIPLILVRFFMVWFCSQEFIVRWGNCLSTPFSASNGVRQGGILSPLFFNVYMDDLSTILNVSKVGCIMNGVNYNHLMYADDLVLLAPSGRALQTLLKTCDMFAADNDITYNITKTVCMFIKPNVLNNVCMPIMKLSGNVIKCVTSHKYLGVHVTADMKDDIDIRYQCRNIYSRGNMLIRNFKSCSDSVKCQLFQSFCTSIYCAPLWTNYSKVGSLDRLKVAYNRVFRILMNLQHRTSMSENFISRGLNPFTVVVRKLIGSFRNRVLHSDNSLVKTIVDSIHFIYCKLTRKWNNAVLTFRA